MFDLLSTHLNIDDFYVEGMSDRRHEPINRVFKLSIQVCFGTLQVSSRQVVSGFDLRSTPRGMVPGNGSLFTLK